VLTAYVACALAPAIQAACGKFEAANPGKSVKIESGESAALVRKIEGGAAPDVFICIGDSESGLLEREGFMDTSLRRSVGSFGLALARPAAKPQLARPDDLASDRIRSIAMPLAGVTSLGTDAKHALDRMGLWSKVESKLALRQSGAEALAALAKGDADAGVIYDPCPLLKLEGKIAAGSVASGPALTYPSARPIAVEMGIHKRGPRTQLAQKLIAFIRSDEMKSDLAAAGIPTGEKKPG
jgi:molybdate transport system substrate-binding protein